MSLKQDELNLIETLEKRFHKNMHRHPNEKWDTILNWIKEHHDTLDTLYQMEVTGGEIDIWSDQKKLYFVDFTKESPIGRRSLCYDEKALFERKENKPIGSAMGYASKWGVTLLDERDYLTIQQIEPFDLKTSSWVLTPDAIRQLDGALNGDNRYKRAFIYHNGATSYFGSRGFRAKLELK